MAIKTMTGATTGQNPYSKGWHTVTITKAEEGNWNDTKYIDVFFDGYKDNFKLRVYPKYNATTNEEFAVARLFKLANAGIISVLKDETGNKPVIQYDDNLENLAGKKLNVFVVPDKKNDKYSRIWDRFAPVEQEGQHLTYTADDVTYYKGQAEDAYNKFGKPNSQDKTENWVHNNATETKTAEEMPF